MLTAKIKKNQFVAMATPAAKQKSVARRELIVALTSGQRACHESNPIRNKLVQTNRCARISGGGTPWSNFQYPGIKPQVVKQAMPAMSAEVSCDLAEPLRKIDIGKKQKTNQESRKKGKRKKRSFPAFLYS